MGSYNGCSVEKAKNSVREIAKIGVSVKRDCFGNEIAHFFDQTGKQLGSVLIFPESLMLD